MRKYQELKPAQTRMVNLSGAFPSWSEVNLSFVVSKKPKPTMCKGILIAVMGELMASKTRQTFVKLAIPPQQLKEQLVQPSEMHVGQLVVT